MTHHVGAWLAALSSSLMRSRTTAINAASELPGAPDLDVSDHAGNSTSSIKVPARSAGWTKAMRVPRPPGRAASSTSLAPLLANAPGRRRSARRRRHGAILTSAVEEAPDRCLGGERLQQLDEGSAYRDHGLLDPLRLHHLPIQRFDPVTTPVTLQRSIQVVHGDRHVVDIDQLHRREAKAPGCNESRHRGR